LLHEAPHVALRVKRSLQVRPDGDLWRSAAADFFAALVDCPGCEREVSDRATTWVVEVLRAGDDAEFGLEFGQPDEYKPALTFDPWQRFKRLAKGFSIR
jgi:hypothetical protein